MNFWTKSKLKQVFKKLISNLGKTRDQPKADETRDVDLLDQIELFDFNCIYNGFGAVVVIK
jgi:hypothetical protein